MNDNTPLKFNDEKPHYNPHPNNNNFNLYPNNNFNNNNFNNNPCELTIDEKLQNEIPLQPVLIAGEPLKPKSYCTPLSACIWFGVVIVFVIIIVAIASSSGTSYYPYNKTNDSNFNKNNTNNMQNTNQPNGRNGP